MKETTIRVADSLIKELLRIMKFKKALGQLRIEDEFTLLILYGLEAKKKIVTIDLKPENDELKLSSDVKQIIRDVKKGRKRGNCKQSVGRKV